MQVSACCDVVQVTPTSTSVLHLSQGFIKPLLRTSPEWSARATWTNNSSGTGSLVGRGLKTGLELCETNTESCERQGAGHREKGNTEKPCLRNWGRSAKCSWRSRCLSWDWREEKVFFRWQVRWSGGAEVEGLGIAQAAAYLLGCVRLSVTQWTVAHQASLSMEFFRQEYWRGLPCTSSRGSPWHRDQGCISCLAGGFFTTEPAGKPGIAHTQAVHRTEHYPCRSCSGSVREREAGQASRCWARRCLVNCVKKSLLQRKVLTVLVGT